MRLKVKVIKEMDVRYLQALMGVRYYSDCKYSLDNGNTWKDDLGDTEEDEEKVKGLLPGITTDDIGYGENTYWKVIIDLEDGKVLNWNDRLTLSTHFKVCDDGEYKFLDDNMDEIVNLNKSYGQCYVPEFMSIDDEGFGDYVHLTIHPDGTIENYEKMKEEIYDYFDIVNKDEY